MARTPKKLVQVALDSTVTARYTVPAATKTQVVSIHLVNTSLTTTRNVFLYAHGVTSSNAVIGKITIRPEEGVIAESLKIILEATEVLAAKQDSGADVILTAYGVEEV